VGRFRGSFFFLVFVDALSTDTETMSARRVALRAGVAALTLACVGCAVLVCGVMLARTINEPAEMMYEHKGSWGGFLRSEQRARSPNDLSINDVQLLKDAEQDIKKQHKQDIKTKRMDQAAYTKEKEQEKLARLKKQKAAAKAAAADAALARAAPKRAPKAVPLQPKKGLKLSRRDKQLLDIANKQIKRHHAAELAEEKRDQQAEQKVQKAKEAKDKARAAYAHAASRAAGAKSSAVSEKDTWGGFLPKVSLPGIKAKAAKGAAAPKAAAPADSRVVATEKALKAVGVNGAALKLLASAEKSQKHDTKIGNEVRQRDDIAFYQMAKKGGSIFFDHKAQEEATKENRHIQQEASIGLTKATEDDDYEYREHAWKQ